MKWNMPQAGTNWVTRLVLQELKEIIVQGGGHISALIWRFLYAPRTLVHVGIKNANISARIQLTYPMKYCIRNHRSFRIHNKSILADIFFGKIRKLCVMLPVHTFTNFSIDYHQTIILVK